MRRWVLPALLVLGAGAACSSADDEVRDEVDAGADVAVPSADGVDGVDGGGGGPDVATPPAADGGAPAEDAGIDAGDGGESSADGGADAAVPFVEFDINHILVTGQSNAVANGGDPPLTTAQPYGNLSFDTGVMPSTDCDGEGCKTYQTPAAFVPLVEGDTFFYPVETQGSAMANEISRLATTTYGHAKHDVLVTNHGRSGNTYACLRKGGCNYKPGYLEPFDQGVLEVTSAKALAKVAGRSHVVRAILAVHGESDHYSYGTGMQEFPLDGTDGSSKTIKDYADGLLEWQRDYETGVKAITGQTQPIPFLITQLPGWTDVTFSVVAQMQLDAHVRSGGKVIMVGPGYPLDVREDCLHLSNGGQQHLGELVAKVYGRVVLGGATWEPVRPKQITRAGAVVTVKYFVPVPPLVLDTTRVTNPGNFGFEVLDDSGATPAVTGVTVSGPDTITITLASAPAGPNVKLRYAQHQPEAGTACIGPGLVYAGGARGNVRDSDATVTSAGHELFDWGVMFEAAVP